MRDEIEPAAWNAQTFEALDGAPFPYTAWRAEDHGDRSPQAVILAVHGLSGAVSDWWPLGEFFEKRGVSVYGYELRGMGNDPDEARRGHVESRERWFEDFAGFALRLQRVYPRTPIFWYGESLGSVISLYMTSRAERWGLRPAGLISASPIVEVDGKLPRWQTLSLKVMARVQPRKLLKLESLAAPDAAPARVVSTVTHAEQMTRTPHAVSHFSLRLLDEIARTVRDNRLIAKDLRIPILMLYSGHDVFTKPDEVERFFRGLPATISKEKHFYPNGYHLLLHDHDRQRVLQDVEAWLEVQLKRNS